VDALIKFLPGSPLGSQLGSFRLQLRTEVKYRREFIQNTAYIPNNPGDVIFGLALQFVFGALVPPPPAPTPPSPPPPPDGDNDGVPQPRHC
jgi:hypothetical protein